MSATFDCRAVAERFNDWVRLESVAMSSIPKLAVVLLKPRAGAASVKYRNLILQDATRLNVRADSFEPESEGELVSLIGRLNKDHSISGILVFYPVGGEIPDEDLMDMVSPLKDVEGLHSINLGYLIKYKKFLDAPQSVKCVVPATAKAIVKTLQEHHVPIERAFVTIINNSMRVGKPLGLMLENLGATVVNCHDKTKTVDLEACARRADILITAVPNPLFSINPAWVKPDSAVVDVSYEGNIDVIATQKRAKLITSPHNQIGQVTRALLFVNLLYCAKALNNPNSATPARFSSGAD
jgi:5,10-methylene-tetrahydrofolate dehydrogenase/methenyl tetrahydrofolate cyclohydrolase